MIIIEKIDSLLNSITMYRLVLYGLIVISGIAIIFGFFGILPYSGIQFIGTLVTLVVTGYLSNKLFAKIVGGFTNPESFLITVLILFLIIAPINDSTDLIITIVVGVIAMASKYIFAIEKKHIFNPAGIALFILSLFGIGNAIWWAGSSVLLPFVAIIGLLIVRKIRRFRLFFAFCLTSFLSVSFFNFLNELSIQQSFVQVFTSWPLVFFGTIMLTEPLTTPPNKKFQLIYGGFVGILFGSQFSLGPLQSSPEFALVVGNTLSCILSPKGKLFLTLKEKIRIAPNIYEFIFVPNSKFNYLPGQYLEWTLPHDNPDSRGIRRYFTIASSPEEENIKLGVKIIQDKSSSFKKALLNMKTGEIMGTTQLAGDFVLPKLQDKKLVFIAGGIGITPFRSMTQHFLKTNTRTDAILYYSASDSKEFVYKDLFKETEKIGLKTVYVLGGKELPPKDWKGEIGYLNEAIIKKYVPDFKNRRFYLSGPTAMVNNYKSLLNKLGISSSEIVTDYFSGY